MHAQVSKEILETGDWITPRFNGEKFFDKPILHYWLVSLSFRFLGVNELAARLPAAILGLGGNISTIEKRVSWLVLSWLQPASI